MAIIKYPYTNLHELNLDWIIEQLNKEGPVVSVNGKQGIVSLTGQDIARTSNNSQTVEQALTSQGNSIQTARNEIGVTPLPTTAQTLTGAIAEHETDITGITNKIGNTPLPTIAQTLTGAIAENTGEVADIQDNIGSTALPTTAQTITGAIAEHESDIIGINNKIGNTPLPTTAQTLTGAIAEHETDIVGLHIIFGDPSKEITQNLQDNWTSAVPNDTKSHFVQIQCLYGDFFGTITRYSNNYGTGVVSRYDGRVYRITMNAGICAAYQIQNRPIQIVATESLVISTNGNISYTFPHKSVVLAAYSTASDIVCAAYPSSGADASGNTTWWIHCRNANSAGAVASGTITCYLVYIDME